VSRGRALRRQNAEAQRLGGLRSRRPGERTVAAAAEAMASILARVITGFPFCNVALIASEPPIGSIGKRRRISAIAVEPEGLPSRGQRRLRFENFTGAAPRA